MRRGDVKVSAGNLREELHDPKNNLCQKPVGIIENYGQPRQEWRGQEREEGDRENKEGNRNDQQVREQ